MGSRELLTQLRRRLSDDRASVPAFVFGARVPMATDVTLEVRNGRLRTNVENGPSNAVEVNLDLSSPTYGTLGRVVDYLKSPALAKQYDAQAAEGMVSEHPSIDIEEVTFDDMNRNRVTLRTRRWSDAELLRLIATASRRHNPSYLVDSLPAGEQDMVLQLAHVEALRVLATDAAKRRGLEGTSSDLLSVAAQLEEAYNTDSRRLRKALTPYRTDDDAVREGDIVVGTFTRQGLRSGFAAPAFASLQPQAPLLYTPDDRDIGDFFVVLRWRRTREAHVHSIELWRDTVPDVRKTRDQDTFVSTSSRVTTTNGGNNYRDPEGMGTADLAGELTSAVVDGFVVPPVGRPVSTAPNALLPDTTYWWRLYLTDQNGEWVVSEPVQARTKRERALFSRVGTPPFMSIVTGSRVGGDAITIRGTKFTENAPVVTFAGVPAGNQVIVDDTTITCTSPSTHAWAPEYADVVLTSASGLRDVAPNAWRWL